ncbi:MAG: Ig domain-containing protein, partial [Bacteroidales bacterium]|nr:Ig domain-containing protein [Bacteroidales bacterium]
NAKIYPVTGVSLDKTAYEMTEGDEFLLTATITPDNATNKNVTWSSSDSSVASVVNGKVTALKAGTATITVKTEDGDKAASCSLTVKRPSPGVDIEDWGDDDKDDGGIAS